MQFVLSHLMCDLTTHNGPVFAMLQIKNRCKDPVRNGSDIGSKHRKGMIKMAKELRAELAAAPSSAVNVIDHGLQHYYSELQSDSE
jgi:hypothetical protein